MKDATLFDPMADETSDQIAAIKSEIRDCVDEWEQIKQKLLADKEETRQLRIETRARIDRLQEQVNNLSLRA